MKKYKKEENPFMKPRKAPLVDSKDINKSHDKNNYWSNKEIDNKLYKMNNERIDMNKKFLGNKRTTRHLLEDCFADYEPSFHKNNNISSKENKKIINNKPQKNKINNNNISQINNNKANNELSISSSNIYKTIKNDIKLSNIVSKNNNNNSNLKNNINNINIKKEKVIENNINQIKPKNFPPLKKLPILNFKSEILRKIYQNRITIISGNTGCGKSTQVPQYLYRENQKNKILMTQPRRIATVSIAKRLAEEMDEKLGQKVGYHVSMNHNFSEDTQILVQTTGVFLENIIHKNMTYTHIILDEVHERDIYVDLVLALIKWYFEQNKNSKTKIILMSATIAEESFAKYLKDINGSEVPIIRIKESVHMVYEFSLDNIFLKIRKEPRISKELKDEINVGSSTFINMMKTMPCFMKELFPVCAALIQKIDNENRNNKNGILIFIPGLAEILDLKEYLQNFFEQKLKYLEFLILHSQINDADQDKIFKNNNKRKIILATNIAESSITISNIDFVIDFCLVKQNRYDPNQNSSFLELNWCSKTNIRQRKGRIGRVNTGYYFRLITKELYESLEDHPIPEILRISLENPILKLKLYEPNYEPNDILLRTITPPNEELIFRTIFRLEKMGALTKGSILSNNSFSFYNDKKLNYKSGFITTVGKIFAELPLDIKYSRLIVISYALGEIDLGITLAAILSQDRPIFISSEKINRYNLYESKNYFSLGKECDFITCYTAYKKWYYDYGHFLVNNKVKFDTQLSYIDPEKYKEIVKYTKEKILDLKVLKEVMRVENDLKKRLTKFGVYCTNFETYKDPKKIINFQDDEKVLILKIILTGTFYNQIYIPVFENSKNISLDNNLNKEEEKEILTVRMKDLPMEKAQKIGEIFNGLLEPDNDHIVDMEKDECDIYKIEFNRVEAVKKILFITSVNNRRNSESPLFCFQNNLEEEEKSKKRLSKKNMENNENISLIQLEKDLDYYYRLNYFDENLREYVNQNRDSVNYIQIISKYRDLKKCKLVTESFHGKMTRNNIFLKYSHFSSVLPPIENFDKLIMLVFAPKYQMMGAKNPKTGKYLRYTGFQGHEFIGMNTFTNFKDKEKNFVLGKTFLIKFDYLLTNYHLNIINEIRVMLNKVINFKFVSKKTKKNDDELSQEEFNELYLEYKTDVNKIIDEIKRLLNTQKIRNISNEKYQELFDYINEINHSKNSGKSDYLIEESEMNDRNNDMDIEDDSSDKTLIINTDSKPYSGYINSINELKLKVKPDDFLQLHDPLLIEEEFHFGDQDTIKALSTRDYKIKNLYNKFNEEIKKLEKLAITKTAYIVCEKCHAEICKIDSTLPEMTNEGLGEHKIQKSWINDTFKEIYKKKDGVKKKKYESISDEKINRFVDILNENKIEYDNILCCSNKRHPIGYKKNGDNFIFHGSQLSVKYPDLTFDVIESKDFKNDFEEIKNKLVYIMKYKTTDEFKSKIFCKLCDFTVKEDLFEFTQHIKSPEHENRLMELRKEFI